MEFELEAGSKNKITRKVADEMTADNFGSGGVEVLATPVMVGFMENAALGAVDSHLPEGYATVGYHLDIKHLSPTPVGMEVEVTAELVEVDGRQLTFEVKAEDESDIIGEGRHIRMVIEKEKFMEQAGQKA